MLTDNCNDTYLPVIVQIDEHYRHLIGMLNDTFYSFGAPGRTIDIEKVIKELVNWSITPPNLHLPAGTRPIHLVCN